MATQLAYGYGAGGVAIASAIASTTLNGIFAASVTNIAGIQLLGFVSVGLSGLCIASLAFFVFCYIRKVNAKPIVWTASFCWRLLFMGIAITIFASLVSATTLVWTSIRVKDLPKYLVGQSTKAMLGLWWGLWGATAVSELACFGILCHWSKNRLHANSVDQLSLDFGIPEPPPMEERPQTRETTRSFQSQDPTLTATPPRTPTGPSSRNSLRSSSSTKVRPTNSRTKLNRQNSFPRDSAKSSLDFAPTETGSVEDGFDKWDTSGVGRDMRRTLQASPPTTRAGLETIPGSRPESPAKPLDGPFLPESPHASTIDTTNIADSFHFPSSPFNSSSINQFPSPPSSPPPNFSRPTSHQYNTPFTGPSLTLPPPTPPMEELIHPLFRSNSPSPAPTPTSGTSVHAAPMAGQTISQRTVTRMRSGSLNQAHSPSPLGQYDDPEPEFPQPGAGSPGPSISEEEEQQLPPILPGFVLGAGQRSSLLGYGKRKSVKGRSESTSGSTIHTSSL